MSIPTPKAVRDGRALPRELLDNGQGKCGVFPVMNEESGCDMEISAEGSAEAATTTPTEGMHKQAHELLLPPIINATGQIATGATMHILRKQNKLHRNDLLRAQPVKTQWEQHRGETLLPEEHWEHRQKNVGGTGDGTARPRPPTRSG